MLQLKESNANCNDGIALFLISITQNLTSHSVTNIITVSQKRIEDIKHEMQN